MTRVIKRKLEILVFLSNLTVSISDNANNTFRQHYISTGKNVAMLFDIETWASFVDMIFANNVIEAAASVAIEQ